jgi:hypothetical protein
VALAAQQHAKEDRSLKTVLSATFEELDVAQIEQKHKDEHRNIGVNVQLTLEELDRLSLVLLQIEISVGSQAMEIMPTHSPLYRSIRRHHRHTITRHSKINCILTMKVGGYMIYTLPIALILIFIFYNHLNTPQSLRAPIALLWLERSPVCYTLL